MKATEKAYLAGFLDGEGCFTLIKQGNGPGLQSWSPAVFVGNTNPKVIRWIQKEFGGAIYCPPREKGHKKFYHLRLNHLAARSLIKEVLPYLRMKAKVAELVMNFPRRSQTTGGRGNHTCDVKQFRKQVKFVEKVRKLNRRGVPIQ